MIFPAPDIQSKLCLHGSKAMIYFTLYCGFGFFYGGRKDVIPFGLKLEVGNTSSNNNRVDKIIAFEFVALQKPGRFALDSTCVVLSAVLRHTSQIVADIRGLM